MGSWVDMGFALIAVEDYTSYFPVYPRVVLLKSRKAEDDILSDREYVKDDVFLMILKL